jgi:hypothetical protein
MIEVAFLPGLFDGFGVTAVLTAAAVMKVLLAARMFFLGQETSGRNMEDLGTNVSAKTMQA